MCSAVGFAYAAPPMSFRRDVGYHRASQLPPRRKISLHRVSSQRICAPSFSNSYLAAKLSANNIESEDEVPTNEDAPMTESPRANSSQEQSQQEICQTCGRNDGPIRGCDGTGRIVGGLGAVVDWWPIKAYRPCPELVKVNKEYRRSGQSLNEIAFGRTKSR